MRQLSLFKGKKQRGVRPKPPLEFASHCLIADILRRWCNPSWRYTHVPLGEHRVRKINPRNGRSYSPTGNRLKRMGVMPGWPDFQFAGPRGQMFFLELKRKGSGRLSEEQADICSHLAAAGFNILITDSVDDAIATLKQLGIVRATIEVQ
jgi:hypothetical protein